MSDAQQEPDGQARVVWPEHEIWPQGGYANLVAVNHTPWDFTIRFAHVTLPPPAPEPSPEPIDVTPAPVAQVTLAPVAVLQLSALLQNQIAQYTQGQGPIGGAPEMGLP